MKKEKFKIEIESTAYETKKEFNKEVIMDEVEFLAFCSNMLEFFKLNKVEDYVELPKVPKP